MAQLNKTFDPAKHEEMADFSALPAGEYMAHITASEMKPTKNKQGQYLQLEFTVDSAGFTGRKTWTRLNLVNASENAVSMAERELKSICDALGLGPITQTEPLHGKPLIIKLKVEPASAQYGESNSIVAYKKAGNSISDTGGQQTVPGMETQTQAQAHEQDKPSWA